MTNLQFRSHDSFPSKSILAFLIAVLAVGYPALPLERGRPGRLPDGLLHGPGLLRIRRPRLFPLHRRPGGSSRFRTGSSSISPLFSVLDRRPLS